MRDEAGLRWLLPRLRAWLPPGTRALVMLDGHPDPGEAFRRHVATGVDFQHSGTVDADTAIVGTLAARPVMPSGPHGGGHRRSGAGRSSAPGRWPGAPAGLAGRRPGGGGRRCGRGPAPQSAESASGHIQGGHRAGGRGAIRRSGAGPQAAGWAGANRGRMGTRPVGIGGGRRRAALQRPARPESPRRVRPATDPAGPRACGTGALEARAAAPPRNTAIQNAKPGRAAPDRGSGECGTSSATIDPCCWPRRIPGPPS